MFVSVIKLLVRERQVQALIFKAQSGLAALGAQIYFPLTQFSNSNLSTFIENITEHAKPYQ